MKLTGAHDDPNPAPVKELSDVTEAGCGATEAALANSLAKGWLALNQITLSDGSDEDDHRADLLGLGMCAPGHQKALYDAFTSTKFVNLARVSDVSILGNRAVTVDPDVTVTGGAGVTSAVNWGPAGSLDGTPVTRPRWTTTIRPSDRAQPLGVRRTPRSARSPDTDLFSDTKSKPAKTGPSSSAEGPRSRRRHPGAVFGMQALNAHDKAATGAARASNAPTGALSFRG